MRDILAHLENDAAVVVQQAGAVHLESARHLLQHGHRRRFGSATPVVQEPTCLRQAFLCPEVSKLLLHVVRRRQRLIDSQGLFEPGAFTFGFVEVFGVLEDQPAGALEDFLAQRPSASRCNSRRKSERRSLKSLTTWKWSKTWIAFGRFSWMARM
jgi:hypothetical protein